MLLEERAPTLKTLVLQKIDEGNTVMSSLKHLRFILVLIKNKHLLPTISPTSFKTFCKFKISILVSQ